MSLIVLGLVIALLCVAIVWSDATYCACGRRRHGWHPDFSGRGGEPCGDCGRTWP